MLGGYEIELRRKLGLLLLRSILTIFSENPPSQKVCDFVFYFQ
jgi:hypothetical protein